MGTHNNVKRYGVLILFACGHVLVGSMTGWLFPPGIWVEQLIKPAFYPPALAFPVVWTMLYILMGVSLWLFWCSQGTGKRQGYFWYVTQLAVNLLFTPLMFGLQSTTLGSLDAFALLLLLSMTIRSFHRHSRWAAYLLAPYWLWAGFASVLAVTLWWLNP